MRRALVVGINTYPAGSELAGCVADAYAWEEYLKMKKFEVLTVLDHDATKDTILSELSDLASRSKQHDVLAFTYSGHGTYVRDRDADEEDSQDEAIVPVDYQQGHLITDDDLRSVFNLLPPGVTHTNFIDSCYSGTVTRLLGVNTANKRRGLARYLKLPADVENKYLSKLPEPRRIHARQSPDSMNHATVSACLPYEVAWETDSGRGYFSESALNVLWRSGHTLTLQGLLRRLLQDLGPDRWQTPCLDGPERMLKQTLVRKTPL